MPNSTKEAKEANKVRMLLLTMTCEDLKINQNDVKINGLTQKQFEAQFITDLIVELPTIVINSNVNRKVSFRKSINIKSYKTIKNKIDSEDEMNTTSEMDSANISFESEMTTNLSLRDLAEISLKKLRSMCQKKIYKHTY